MLENVKTRDVYLPPEKWIDYQTGKIYTGGWHKIEAGKIPVVVLVREGSVIPHIALAQSTAQMDWSTLNLVIYSTDSKKASGLVCLPSDKVLHTLNFVKKGNIKWKIRLYSK
jgi:alpha-D-xyloside xylohydrolase